MDNEFTKKIVTGIAILLLVIGGLWIAWNLTTAPGGEVAETESVNIDITETDHIKGSEDGAVTLVEYSDFQCPACRSFAPLVAQLIEEHGDDVRFVYKHFPLPQHQKAEEAAFAAEAAGLQGKFFEMHDLLFERQDVWSEEDNPLTLFEEYATELELDIEQFRVDYESKEVKAKVDGDVLSGTQAGVNSTPSFFLNGQKLRNPGSYQDFSDVIAAAIAEASTEADEAESTPSAEEDTDEAEGTDDESLDTEEVEETEQ